MHKRRAVVVVLPAGRSCRLGRCDIHRFQDAADLRQQLPPYPGQWDRPTCVDLRKQGGPGCRSGTRDDPRRAGRPSDAADVARQPPVSASPSAAVVMGTQPAGPRYQ